MRALYFFAFMLAIHLSMSDPVGLDHSEKDSFEDDYSRFSLTKTDCTSVYRRME